MANTSGAAAVCAICLGDLGHGQALIKAECSHVFHLRCVSNNATQGRRDCPLCMATWRDVPVIQPSVTGPYADDDPVAESGIQPAQAGSGVGAADAGTVTLKTHCERPAVPRGASRDRFAVLVNATAPGAAAAEAMRAPLDLVTVLDVSGSMTGNKLELVKQAMEFVIDNLGPADRLSVVSFSDKAKRNMRFTCMSADGKASAKLAVKSLTAGGSTNIRKALHMASEAADEVTQLVSVRCTYTDTATGRAADVAGEDAVVWRPVELLDGDDELSMEVERERVRVAAVEDMAAARAAADRGDRPEARRCMKVGLLSLKRSAAFVAGDEECDEMVEDLEDIEDGMEDEVAYQKFGHARLLGGINTHQMQRASFAGAKARRSFQTRAMECAVKRSKRPAVPRGASRDGFAVLVHATVPGAAAAEAPRAPLDLVTVLDVSGSMTGNKLKLVKQAMGFVIDNLGPADRLSVVSFSHDAKRQIRFTRMSADGKASAKLAVKSLAARGSTNIRKGLDVACQVLAGRRYRNAVTSIILLSDGQDTCGNRGVDLMPPSLRGTVGGNKPGPVHTFGFGTDHDAAAMHAIAETTRGTFSYIVNHEVVQDSFAQCIGGLLSVAMQNVRLDVACVHPGVHFREVKSGVYESRVGADGRAATVEVGDLYADEVRRFLIFVDVPAAEDAEEVTQLIRARCTYTDTATGQAAYVAGEDAVVRRPVELLDGDDVLSMEVERERVRVAAAEDMASARAAADRGDRLEALRYIQIRRAALKKSAAFVAGDEECDELEEDLHGMEVGMEDDLAYKKFGHARLLGGINTHRMQRASFAGGKTRKAFETTSMRCMVKKSREARLQQQDESASAPAPRPSKKERKHK
ncbi:hypothetical protein EJB05_22079, partial [Eragrostis curvula]